MKQSSSFSSQSGVEWYNSGATNQYANYHQWAPPPTAAATGSYGSGFDDEPPLLEGDIFT